LEAAGDEVVAVDLPVEDERANDIAWSTGQGPVVEGPMESLVLVMAGRRAGLDDLTGEGISVLSVRM
jgi:hypothetical protein